MLHERGVEDLFYGVLGEIGALICEKKHSPVVFDATANRRAYRDAARNRVERFAEVLVDTPLEVCAARNPKGLYRTAKTLPGVQASYEPPLAPELVVRGDRGTPQESAARVLSLLEERGWL